MEYRALGPLAVEVAGRALKLGGPRQRMVLAVLLCRANHTVSQDALVEAVWAGEPPEAGKATLQTYIYSLRQQLGSDAILRQGDGYHVEVDADSFDVLAFERLVDEGHRLLADEPRRARAALAEGLGLWYGSPYGGLDGNPELTGEIARLEELRLVAVEDRIAADLDLGNHAAVIGELESLIREYPLRERLRVQHMLALYRSGRQAEALRAFQQARTHLAEELGIDPSAELRDLEQRILDQDPGLRVVGTEPAKEHLAFLFTDVEDSTLLWELHPQLAQSAIDRQDEIITAGVDKHGGSVFKRTGDGLYAHFAAPDDAVAAASESQANLVAADWGDMMSVKVRMAVVTGEVEVRSDDCFGPALHRAARVLAMGHGGQILLSDEVAAGLAEGQSRPLGEHRLRGIGVPESLHQLVVPGLPDEFPPLRTDRPSAPIPFADEGRSVRGYELRSPLGEGDFGVVYRAYQPSLGREVAVKLIRPEHANRLAFVRRFEREAQIVAQLEHPNILPLFDFWRDPDGAYLVMPVMRGGSLADALRRGGWNLAPALHLLDQVGGALAYAHRKGVIHRDLKPGNVLLDEEGNAYLSDFGIATRLTDDAETPFTTSFGFVPPEELAGEPHTFRSDLFSLGVLTFQLVTGVAPSGGLPLPSLEEVRPGLPPELATIVARATAEDPADRFERVEDFLRSLRQAVGADVVAVADPETALRSSEAIRNPYKGLRAFGENDAVDFHGRTAVVDELLQEIASHSLVAVVGPSGSGKSSVVRAGLLPALRAGGVPGSRQWLFTDMFPGSYPFEELEAALLRVAVDHPSDLLTELLEANGLLRVTKRILPGDDSTLVLVIDQFEELFSAVRSEATRRQFIDNLTAVASDERSRLRIVLTMRADFFDRPLEYGEFAEVIGRSMVTVGPPSRDGLAQAIAAPARAVGVDLAPGLVGRIIADVKDQPGGLPLLQYALTEMFSRRQGDTLTINGYEETGGVLAALGSRAEEIYAGLSGAGQEAARQLFLRLVTVDESAADTRRRARQAELKSLDVDQEALDHALRSYGAFRLLSFDRDPITRGPTVEVAHEALLQEWSRLRGWIDEQRESLIHARRLGISTQEWQEAAHDPSFLLRGARLAQIEEWRQTSPVALTSDEADYIEASVAQRSTDEAAVRRRRRRTVVGLAAGLVVVAGLAVVALIQRGIAEGEARDARVRELAGEATLKLGEDPELSMLIALEAVEVSRRAGVPPLPEAIGALHEANQASRLVMRIDGGDADGRRLAVASDGSFVVANGEPLADLIVIDLSSGDRTTLSVSDSELYPFVLAVSPDDRQVAVGYTVADGNLNVPTGPDQPDVVVFDQASGRELSRLMVPDGAYSLDFSPDGDQLAITSLSAMTVWDWRTGTMLAEVKAEFASAVYGGYASFLADGDTIIFADVDGIVFYSVGREEVLHRIPIVDAVVQMVPSPDLNTVAWMGSSGIIEVYDLATRQRTHEIAVPNSRAMAWSPDGTHLAHTGFDSTISVVEVASGTTIRRLSGSRANIFGVAYLDDHRIANVAAGEVLVWDVSPDGPPELEAIRPHSSPSWSYRVSADQTRLATYTSPVGAFELLDMDTGDVLATLEEQNVAPGWGVRTVSPDFSLMGSIEGAGGRSTVRRLPSLEVVHEFERCRSPLVFSPDSSLVLVTGDLCEEGGLEVSQVYELETDRVMFDIPHQWIFSAQFNPPGIFEGGRYLAVTDQAAIEVWDTQQGTRMAELPRDNLVIAFDPSGRYLTAGTEAGRVFVIDFAAVVEGASMDDAVIFDRQLHSGASPAPAVTEDGLVASAGFDGVVRVWDLESDRPVVEFRAETGTPVVAFAADGSYLFYPDAGNIARFPLDPDVLVALAESRLTRDFTSEECLDYRGRDLCEIAQGSDDAA